MERYLTCALVAILLTLYAWLGGGIVAPWLAPWTPWITLLIGEVALLLPEQKRNETLFDARRRVWRGIVRDPQVHRQVLEETLRAVRALGFAPLGLAASPIRGAEGNAEFLLHLRLGEPSPFDAPAAIDAALQEAGSV